MTITTPSQSKSRTKGKELRQRESGPPLKEVGWRRFGTFKHEREAEKKSNVIVECAAASASKRFPEASLVSVWV